MRPTTTMTTSPGGDDESGGEILADLLVLANNTWPRRISGGV
jgi:hypothetical protein